MRHLRIGRILGLGRPPTASRVFAAPAPGAITTILAFFVLMLAGYGSARAQCQAGSTARLTIVNKCVDPVWAVMTSPGSPQQVAVAAQWNWINQYATRENTINTGGKGSIGLGLPKTLTFSQGPNPAFVAGMKIKIIGAAAAGGDLTTAIDTVSSPTSPCNATAPPGECVLTLADAAQTAVTDAQVWLYNGQKAFAVPPGPGVILCVPDKGAPGGNFRFFLGCPSLADNSDPFNTSAGCVIGSSFGDLAGVNTLFEPSFGCVPPLAGSQCAFNPSDSAAQGHPNCPGDPNAVNCGPLSATDFYDISAVDGYTFPMKIEAAGGNCSAPFKDASMLDLASCPKETADTLFSTNAAQQGLIQGQGISLLTKNASQLQACAAPYKWFVNTRLGVPPNPTPTDTACPPGTNCPSSSYYAGNGCNDIPCGSPPCLSLNCPGGSGPQQKVGPSRDGNFSVQNTNFVQHLRALGYTGYTWQYDDGIGGQTCDAGARMTVTLCPPGSSPKPYQENPLWTFSAVDGACTTDGATGAPDGMTTFGSLFECQWAKMQYTCTDLTANDPFHLPVGVWAADSAATLSPTNSSRTYDQVLQHEKLHCETFRDLNIPASTQFAGGRVTVPNCTYYTLPGGHVCPSGLPGGAPPVLQGVIGKVQNVGTGRDSGNVRISGRFTLSGGVRLDQATVTLHDLIDEVVGTGELARNTAGARLLPIALSTRAGSKSDDAFYETPTGVRPSVRIEIKKHDSRTGQMDFSITVDRSMIAGPARCSAGQAPTTRLMTKFAFQAGASETLVAAILPWQCRGTELRTP